jgi:hypothetical protein
MTVVDHEPYAWFLVRDGARLLLDVHCSHSAADYSFLVELNDAEENEYRAQGREFLSGLAHQIHYSAPGVRGSVSPYLDRRVVGEDRARVDEAAIAWVEERRNAL